MPERPSWLNWSSIGWVSTAFSSVVVTRSADIGVEDRHAIGGRPLRRLAIELVVEDGAHRAVGQRADLDRPRGGGFETIGTEWPHEPRQARKPCSGWGRRSRISSHSAAVAGPIE